MDTSTIVTAFLHLVDETLGDLKAKTLAEIDIELLKLKRTQLAEKLEDFKNDLGAKVEQEKAHVEQDMISRGLGNTTIRLAQLARIDRDAATSSARAVREFNRAIEEIAILERRVREQRESWPKKLVRYIRGLFSK